MENNKNNKKYIFSGAFAGVIGFIFISSTFLASTSGFIGESASSRQLAFISQYARHVTHIETPDVLRGFYMTSWSASGESNRTRIVKKILEMGGNAVILDIKDDTGIISFDPEDAYLDSIGSWEKRIPDIVDFIKKLHSDNIYVIGRISVMQDPYIANINPEEMVQTANSTGIWRDRKGLPFFDPGSDFARKYISTIALASYELGFDEINFDYIRYPTDGLISNTAYSAKGSGNKVEVITDFLREVVEPLKEKNIPTSADVFGLVAIAPQNDIGQDLASIASVVDYVAPMLYPSHFSSGWFGYDNPADVPYEVYLESLRTAKLQLEAKGLSPKSLRPWVQDFSLHTTYTDWHIKQQLKAISDSEISSWMSWDPSNVYIRSGYTSI